MASKCVYCKKDISMEVEFGDAYHVSDGDFTCNKDHYEKWLKCMMSIIQYEDWMDDRHWNW